MMELKTIWSIAAATYSLAAVGAVGLGWAIQRRAPRGRETHLLLGALIILALHYGVLATDAFLHTSGATRAPFTLWSGAGQMLSAFLWMLVCLFLLSVVKRLRASQPEGWSPTWSVALCTGLMSAVALFLFGRAAYAQWSGAPADTIQLHIARLMRGWNSFVTLWIVVPSWLMNVLYERLPKAERTGWATWMVSNRQNNLISLDLAGYPDRQAQDTPGISKSDFKSLSGIYATGLLLLAISFLNETREWTPVELGLSVLFRLMLLPSLMGLIYYQARFAFFDVVLKRGLLFLLLAAIAAAIAYFLLPHLLTLEAAPGGAAFCVVATLFAWLSAWLFHAGDRLFDRVIFRRPDYRREFQSIAMQMARCPDAGALSEVLTSRLAEALTADFVEYAPEVTRPAHVVVRIGTPERTLGRLAVGQRQRGQQYGSEDLNFIDAVAAQFAGLLESLGARRSEELAARAELKALRAQINPHFLFNALNTLAEMARGQPETERTILNLARVFRYALDSTRREMVALAEEIEFIRSYLEIEAERFEEKLKYQIEAPGDLLDTPVPPMLIQPLVENALKHGIAPRVDGGTVRIAAARMEHGVRVTVIDDGVGFDPVRATMNVGMTNVRMRVEALGGAWRVESKPGQGTVIALELVTQ